MDGRRCLNMMVKWHGCFKKYRKTTCFLCVQAPQIVVRYCPQSHVRNPAKEKTRKPWAAQIRGCKVWHLRKAVTRYEDDVLGACFRWRYMICACHSSAIQVLCIDSLFAYNVWLILYKYVYIYIYGQYTIDCLVRYHKGINRIWSVYHLELEIGTMVGSWLQSCKRGFGAFFSKRSKPLMTASECNTNHCHSMKNGRHFQAHQVYTGSILYQPWFCWRWSMAISGS